jgi:predicted nucleic acid-binding protein
VIVIDTSALLAVVVGRPYSELLRERILRAELHAPHLLDIEFLHALRGLVGSKALSLSRAEEARGDLDDMRIVRYPHAPLADRVWELRSALSAYDAAFIALAEALGSPLVTCDGRLARARGHSAEVELYS